MLSTVKRTNNIYLFYKYCYTECRLRFFPDLECLLFFSLAEWTSCRRVIYFDSCIFGTKFNKGLKNSHCLANSNTKKTTCKCDEGYFGRPKKPGCMKAGQ